MVQIFNTPPSRKSQLSEMLGMELGKGIGNGINSYYANKAIDDVMNDESLSTAPITTKMGKLSSALAPYGELGQKLFKQRYDIERASYDEDQAKLKKSEDLAKEKRLFAQQKEVQELKNEGKTVNSDNQPIPKEQIDKMEKVLKENPNATPEQLRLKMGKAAVNPKYFEPFVKGREETRTQASKPIEADQLQKIQDVRTNPEFAAASLPKKSEILMNAGVSKENTDAVLKPFQAQTELDQKTFETSYKAQEDFINDTTKSYKAFETDTKPRLLQMRNIPDKDIVSPTSAVFLETLGIPLGALENPGSELYNKLSQDLLKGLPETYGSRILKVEVDNFLKTIPTLLNSPDGRRMIASNMLKLGEMKEVYYNEMRRQQRESLDNSKPLPRDFQQRVFDQVKPQIDRINNDFVKLSEITSVPKDTIPFFAPDGQIKFVPKSKVDQAEKNGGRRIW